MKKAKVKNLAPFARGFLGKTLELEPGLNHVDNALVQIFNKNCKRFSDDLATSEIQVLPGVENGQAKLLFLKKQATVYRTPEVRIGPNETVELEEDLYNALMKDPYFTNLLEAGDLAFLGWV
jgi:hypothetical protein